MQKARFVKYAVLLVVIIVFFLSRNRTTLAADPLISVFNFQFSASSIQWAVLDWQSLMLLVLAAVLLGSLFYRRFWCRYLCPVGAFLSLFNKIAILRRYLPAKKFGRCEFGLTGKDQTDCIYCDRCRYEAKPSTKPVRLRRTDNVELGLLARYLVVGTLAVAILVSAVSVDRFLQVMPTTQDYTAVFTASGGQPRDVDLQRIRTLIDQKRLSDHEAEFYKRID